MTDDTVEIKLGETYTDRFRQLAGPAMEIHASAGGCFQVGLQLPPNRKTGGAGDVIWVFDSHLLDSEGKRVRRPDAIASRVDSIFGKKYRDPSSGLLGTAVSMRFCENGTEQIAIQPLGDGKDIPKAWSIDACLLEEIGEPQVKPVAAAARIGPPAQEARRI